MEAGGELEVALQEGARPLERVDYLAVDGDLDTPSAATGWRT